jgi:glycosyltransferase involved in cell wall biosynthesis
MITSRPAIVSVIVTSYNYARYIDQTINSVLSQTYPHWELIISDDGSTDNSLEIANSFQDQRIKVITSPTNEGACRAYNKAFSVCSGKYLCSLDSDDYMSPERLEKQVRFLEEYPEIDILGTHVVQIDTAGNPVKKTAEREIWFNKDMDLNAPENWIWRNHLCHSSVLMKKVTHDLIGKFDEELVYIPDHAFWLKCLAGGAVFHVLKEELTYYRFHDESVTKKNSERSLLESVYCFSVILRPYLLGLKRDDLITEAIITILSNEIFNRLPGQLRSGLLERMLDFEGVHDGFERFMAKANERSSGRSNIYLTVLDNLRSKNREQQVWCKELEKAKEWLEDQRRRLEFKAEEREQLLNISQQKLQSAEQKLQNTEQKLQSAEQKLQNTEQKLQNTEQKLQSAEQKLQNTEQKLQSAEQKLQNTEQKLQSAEQKFQDELIEIHNSRTYKLATIFRDARHSKRLFLLFPLRFIWFFLPLCIENPIKDIFSRTQKTFCRLRQKKQLWNRPWPKDRPLVSVVIPCYNYGRYVEEAIDSVLAQTWQDFEIIVVDDGSNDPEAIRILKQLRKQKVKIIHQPSRKLPATRNRGIKVAKGKYICCFDADDKIAPTYLEKCVYRLETEVLDICGSWQQNFENDNSILQPEQFSLKTLLESNCMINAALFRRSLWRKIGGYDKRVTCGYEDWEFWIRMAAAGARATVIPEPLFFCRKHGRSLFDATLGEQDDIVQWIRSKHTRLLGKDKSHKYFSDNPQRRLNNRLINLDHNSRPKSDQINVLLAMPFLTVGGVERVISQICCRLSKLDFVFTILTTVASDPRCGDTTSWFRASTEETYHLPKFLARDQWNMFIFYLLRTRNIQILWQAGSTFLYDLLPEIKTHFPSVMIIDLLLNEVGHTANNRKYNYCIDMNIAENQKVKSWLLSHGEDADRVRLIENGVDLEKFKTRPQTRFLRKDYSQGKKRFIVGFFGRFSKEKGPDVFVEIASRLRHSNDVYFVMAGDGPLREHIIRQIETNKLQNRVQLLGIVDVSEHLPQCDIVVVPSRIDGRPNIILESFASGIPVIASNVGGLPEMVDDGYTGFVCNTEDVGAFVSKIKVIVGNMPLIKKIKLNTRREAEEKFDIEKMVHAYAVTFRHLASQSKRFEV